MSLRLQVSLMMGTAFALFLAALVFALASLAQTRNAFTGFLDFDLQVLQSIEGMYAQGLQSGQALRNVTLDPANKKGYENLQKALDEFDQALQTTRTLAGNDTELTRLVQEVDTLKARRKQAIDKTLSLVATDREQAVTTINKEETPVWRELRQKLLDGIKVRRDKAATTKQDTVAAVKRTETIVIAMALLSVISAAIFLTLMLRRLCRQIGGEPAEVVERVRQVAQGNLTAARVDTCAKDSILDTVQDMQLRLREIVQNVAQQAELVNRHSQTLTGEVRGASERVQTQSGRILEISAALEQVSVAVTEAAHAAESVDQAAEESQRVARGSHELMNRNEDNTRRVVDAVDASSQTISELSESTQKISAITNVIRGIAEQTNLLALNAAIEAARAGEQGRGFAVVADEVRKLAERTAASTTDIGNIVGEIVVKTDQAVASMSRVKTQVEAEKEFEQAIAQTMEVIVATASEVTGLAHHIANATREQSEATQQTARNMDEVSALTERNGETIREVGRKSDEMAHSATELQRLMGLFRL